MTRHESATEIEIKLEVRNLAEARRKIRSLGFLRIRPRHFESNTLYDFPDLRLRTSRCLLRVRQVGREWLLTFKGPPADSERYKTRQEIETTVEDGNKLCAILEGLGLRKAFQYVKYRTIFAPKSAGGEGVAALLVLDETPIGDFLELEGSERWIDRTAARLGYGREDYITESYAALYRRYCEGRGEPLGDMVFDSRGD